MLNIPTKNKTISQYFTIVSRPKKLLLLAVMGCASPLLFAADCSVSLIQQADALQQANKSRDAIRIMEKGLKTCGEHSSWQFAGQLYLSAKKYADAKKAFIKAKKTANTDIEKAAAVARYGETLQRSGRRTEALPVLQAAIEMYDTAPDWLLDRAKSLDLALNNADSQEQLITRGFSNQAFALLTIAPSVNIRLNFKSNSEELDAESALRLPLLVEKLSQDKYAGKTIWLIGHADPRGPSEHNMKLSWSRSEALRDTMVAIAPLLKERLKIDGKGENEPLYPGMDAQDNMLNRRLQIIIE